jgi:hypothetical protein
MNRWVREAGASAAAGLIVDDYEPLMISGSRIPPHAFSRQFHGTKLARLPPPTPNPNKRNMRTQRLRSTRITNNSLSHKEMITIKQRVPTQYGRNNFSPDCPWQLYIFSFMHMLWGFQAYFCFDMSQEITLEGTPSTDAEVVMQQLLAFSMLYVGVLFAAMTYHNKH